MKKLGFIQGRLSPIIDGKIQCFPGKYWEAEFPQAQELGLGLMEWTLDIDDIYQNPLMTKDGQQKIRYLMDKHQVKIPSLTGDFLMQFPFYKSETDFEKGQKILKDVVQACSIFGIQYLVFPLVDAGRLENRQQEDRFISLCLEMRPFLKEMNVQFAFESDFPPAELKRMISRLPSETFSINYDMGNSGALGFKADEELAAYGDRVSNVHIKDRVLGGTTVPLGTGNVNFEMVFHWIQKIGYQGNLIFQSARAQDGDHLGALKKYMKFVEPFLKGLS